MACRNGVCAVNSGGSNMPRTKGVQLSQPQGLVNQLQLPKQKTRWTGYEEPDIIGINNYTPEQQNVLNYLLQSGKGQLENPYQGFEPIKQNALSTFFQEIVPALQEQFSASGSNSASSGTIKSQLSGAGANLAEKLAAFQAHFGQQNQQNALQQLQLGLNPRTDFINRPGQGGWAQGAANIASGILPSIGRTVGSWFGWY